ncbi:hypothetical protein H5410_062169, partial [Solanum commersonii]
MDYYGLLGCGVVVVVLGWTLIHGIRCYNYKKKILLPPGPFSLPFIGNLHNLILGGWLTIVAKEAFKNQDLALSSKIDKDALHAHDHNQFSLELGIDKIRVNSIAPGVLKSEITESLMQKKWLGPILCEIDSGDP